MNRYIQIIIQFETPEESDILIARLNQAGFEGFEEEPKKLYAYIPESLYDNSAVENIIRELKTTSQNSSLFEVNLIEPKNWNEEWEKNFEPVVISDFCAIRAQFHSPVKGVQHDLVITPKM